MLKKKTIDKKKKVLPKLFVIRKYIFAHSAQEALRREKDAKPDDCWLDEGWKAMNQNRPDAIGFSVARQEEDY